MVRKMTVFKNPAVPCNSVTVGSYLATRLSLLCDAFFTVPGDYTLGLLDELIRGQALTMITTTNELNAGYAADGYSRATGGIGVAVVTYMVGGLSILNAVAGAYAEDIPLLIVSGAPNTNDLLEHHIVHHTIGTSTFQHSVDCFRPVTCATFQIRHVEEAAEMIDCALKTCQLKRKPVYLEIPSNLCTAMICEPAPSSMQLCLTPQLTSDMVTLEACVTDITRRLNDSAKPVIIVGAQMRYASLLPFEKFATKLGCAVATQPDGKGLFPESHPLHIGTYWGQVSTPLCAEVVESADIAVHVGCRFNDYNTAGWSAILDPRRIVDIKPACTSVCGKRYTDVHMDDVLAGLAGRVGTRNKTAQNYQRFVNAMDSSSTVVVASPTETQSPSADAALTLRDIKAGLQGLLSPSTDLLVDVGDAWFLSQELRLPDGCNYHMQFQYGSTGWALGAALGLAVVKEGSRDIVCLMGDGAFQMSMQEVSTMIRHNLNLTVVVVNNGAYTTDVCIHDGPYNVIQCWDYAGLVDAFNAEDGKGLGLKVTKSHEMKEALVRAQQHDGFTLIECVIPRDDCSLKLLEWGPRVARSNMHNMIITSEE